MQINEYNTKKILWVEDSVMSLKGLIRPLMKKGYRFSFARTQKEALEELDRDIFDLIMLDIIIPTGSEDIDQFIEYAGLSLIREIVKVRKIKTPIIILSVVNDPEVLREFETIGVERILQKGYILPSTLEEEVENILKN